MAAVAAAAAADSRSPRLADGGELGADTARDLRSAAQEESEVNGIVHTWGSKCLFFFLKKKKKKIKK